MLLQLFKVILWIDKRKIGETSLFINRQLYYLVVGSDIENWGKKKIVRICTTLHVVTYLTMTI